MAASRLAICGTMALILALGASPGYALFVNEDIGNTTPAGGVSPPGVQPPDPVTITADGGDIWGTADAFHYYHDAWSGNFLATVRFTGIVGGTSGDGWRKMGIMARADTTPGSPQTFIAATPQQVALQWRDGQGIDSGWPNAWVTGSPGAGSAPFWLSLRRQGSTFTAQWAADVSGSPGVWSTVTPVTDVHANPGLPNDIRLGLAVTSHSFNQTTIASFDNFSIEALASPVGRIGLYDHANVGGAAYAEVPPSGPIVGPVHWEVHRMDVQQGLKTEWYVNDQNWGTPSFDFMSSQISMKGTRPPGGEPIPQYPQPVIDYYTANMGGIGTPNDYIENYSVKLTGEIYIPADGLYSFCDGNDDRTRLWIDGGQVIWDDGAVGWDQVGSATSNVSLEEGWQPIEFRMSEGGGGDCFRLRWDPANSTNWQDIPEDYLRVMTVGDLLAWDDGNVGSPTQDGIFVNIGNMPGELLNLRLSVSYQGDTKYYYGQFMGIPEPTTCLLLGGGLLALMRRRRRSR